MQQDLPANRFAAHAQRLAADHANGARFAPFAASIGIAGIDEAYDAQDAFVAELLKAGNGRRAGYKIGLTSKRMQEMCGIDVPVGGVVLASRVMPSGGVAEASRFGRLGLEFEICTILSRDLPARPQDYTAGEVETAVGEVCAAIEMVDDRNCDYATLDVFSLVADNSWNAGVVLGKPAPRPADLTACEGVVSLDGAVFDRGYGRDVLGGPLVPLTWLANHLSRRGEGLRAGDIVMTGSLIPTQFPKGACTYSFDVAGIGSVELTMKP